MHPGSGRVQKNRGRSHCTCPGHERSRVAIQRSPTPVQGPRATGRPQRSVPWPPTGQGSAGLPFCETVLKQACAAGPPPSRFDCHWPPGRPGRPNGDNDKLLPIRTTVVSFPSIRERCFRPWRSRHNPTSLPLPAVPLHEASHGPLSAVGRGPWTMRRRPSALSVSPCRARTSWSPSPSPVSVVDIQGTKDGVRRL